MVLPDIGGYHTGTIRPGLTLERSAALSDQINDQALLPFDGDGRIIRRQWVSDRWFFSVVDVVAVLTDSDAPRQYWGNLKRRVQDEGFTEVLSKRDYALDAPITK